MAIAIVCNYFPVLFCILDFKSVTIYYISDGIVYSFNVDVGKPVATKAEALNISIRQFDIIYKLLDDLKVCCLVCGLCCYSMQIVSVRNLYFLMLLSKFFLSCF